MKFLIFIYLYLFSITAVAQTVFETVLGAKNREYLASSMVEAKAGGFVISGTASGGGTGDTDVFLAKLDEDGQQQWVKTIYTPKAEFNVKLIHAHDSGYFLSATTYSYVQDDADSLKDILILRLDTAGNEIWRKVLPARDNYDCILSKEDGYYVLGDIKLKEEDKKSPDDRRDILVYKLDVNGDVIWNTKVGTDKSDFANEHTLYLSSQNILLVGGGTKADFITYINGYLNALNSNGKVLWSKIRTAFENRHTDVTNFLKISDTLYFNYNGFQPFDPLSGTVYSGHKGERINDAVTSLNQNYIATIVSNDDPTVSCKIWSNQFEELFHYTVKKQGRVFAEQVLATSDGGYAFLMRWQQETGVGLPYEGNFTGLILKTDCNGNFDRWKACTLGEREAVKGSSGIKIYPNPTIDRLIVTIPVSMFPLNYQIHTTTGQLVQSGRLEQTETSLVTSKLPKGLYVLSVVGYNPTSFIKY